MAVRLSALAAVPRFFPQVLAVAATVTGGYAQSDAQGVANKMKAVST